MREDPHPLTAYFLRRSMMGALGQIPLWIAALTGVGMFAMQWLIRREGGPGYRWRQSMLRRYPKKK